MIGVDIIDLSCSFDPLKYSLSDYKNRILNKVEYLFCENFEDLNILWAIKESAYKCFSKQTGRFFLNPKKIMVTGIDEKTRSFNVEIDGHYYNGNFEKNERYIYAISFDITNRGEEVKVFMPEKNPLNLKKEMEYFFRSPSKLSTVSIHSGGFPDNLYLDSKAYSYSRSHHGAYYISVLLAN